MNAWRYASLQIARSLGTSAAVALALGMVFGVSLLIGALYAAASERATVPATPFQAIIGPKTDGLSLVLDALTLQAPPEDVIPYGMLASVAEVVPDAYVTSLHVVTRHAGSWVLATEDVWLDRPAPLVSPQLVAGHWVRGLDDVVVGSVAAARLGLELGDSVALQGSPSVQMVEAARLRAPERPPVRQFDPVARAYDEVDGTPLWAIQASVVGVVSHDDPVLDDALYVHRSLGEHKHAAAYAEGAARRVSRNGATSFLFVHLPTPAALPELEAMVHRNSTTMFADVALESAALRELAADGRRAAAVATGVLGLLLVLGLGVVLAARIQMLAPRLALLRALGYAQRWVFAVLTLELCLLLAVGWLLGWTVAVVLSGPLGTAVSALGVGVSLQPPSAGLAVPMLATAIATGLLVTAPAVVLSGRSPQARQEAP